MQVSVGLESVSVNVLGYHFDSPHPNIPDGAFLFQKSYYTI